MALVQFDAGVNLSDVSDMLFSYSGISATVYHSEVTATPERDDAKRTVTGTHYNLHVIGLVTPEAVDGADSTDLPMDSIRDQLSKDGGILLFSGNGYGKLNVNTGGVWDSKYGPKVEKFRWRPLGGMQAAILDIELSTVIPNCPGAKYRNALMALNFSHNLDFDQNGIAIIHTKGYAEIPMTRTNVSSRIANDHISEYLTQMATDVPVGFQRKSRPIEFSLDGRRADFDYTDTQMPTVLPPFASTIELTEDLGSSLKQGAFTRWAGSLHGSVTCPVTINKARSFAIFFNVVINRLQRSGLTSMFADLLTIDTARPATGILGQAFLNSLRTNGWLMITEVRATEQVFGLRSDYEVKFQIISQMPLFRLLTASGFWKPSASPGPQPFGPGPSGGPLPRNYHPDTFSDWKASMANVVTPRGPINYQFNRNADVILDLCMPGESPQFPNLFVVPGQSGHVASAQQTTPPSTSSSSTPQARLSQLGVTPELSWLFYEPRLVYLESESTLARHKPMGSALTDISASNPSITDTAKSMLDDQSDNYGSQQASVPDTIQQIRTPSPRIKLILRAARLGYKIPIPRIRDIGGIPCTEARRLYVVDTVLTVYGGVPLYGLAVAIEYWLPSVPAGDLPTPANPLLGLDGSA